VSIADPTARFSDRVENYVKYRPSYPSDLVDLLVTECGLTPNSVIADIGSGTGILTQLLLDRGYHVFAVEPNQPMRAAAERALSGNPRFHSIEGRAEATGLAGASVDLITVGQAFHWFDRGRARDEFARILKPAGWVALIWNERLTDSTEFLRAYDDLLLEYGTDYAVSVHRHVPIEEIRAWFQNADCRRRTFSNTQRFDYESLLGRVLSSSYVPAADHPNQPPLIAKLRRIFDQHQVNGQVAFEYRTELYYGCYTPLQRNT
jgi:SAM-dependent methyltransferase